MTDQKSWPDVADKALTGIGDVVRGIAESVEKVAPRAWDALVSYHRAVAIGELCVVVFWSIFFAAVLVVAALIANRARKEATKTRDAGYYDRFDPFGWYMTSFVSALFSLVILSAISFDLPRVIANALAPEYPAAMELIEKARGCK